MDMIDFRSATLVILTIAFCGLIIWAWSPKRKQAFKQAAEIVLEDDLKTQNNKESQT